MDLDSKNTASIQSFQESIKYMSRMKRNLKTLKLQLLNLEKQFNKEKLTIQNGFEEISSIIKILPKPQQNIPNKNIINKEKIQKILKNLVPISILANFEKIPNFNSPIKLLNNFNISLITEEPEIELNSDSENKKLISHANMLTKALEKVAMELLKILNEECSQIPHKNQGDVKILEDLNNSISPNDLKVLKLKINRLHNRGSLTDEEAKNMLGKISIMPISPNHNEIDNSAFLKGNFDLSAEIICDENPVTETREKQEKLGASFTKDLNKKIKVLKSKLKRSSTPAKRITRNTSLPKAISVAKYKTKDKLKLLKVKAKSPHSFM